MAVICHQFCKSGQCDAMTWLRWGQHPSMAKPWQHHGMAVLCSNIHQWGLRAKNS
nr:MAG TPA: hypothetical protein [Caudoviricetes sp.]